MLNKPHTALTGAGWRVRETRAKAKIEKANDPARLLVMRVRHRDSSLAAAEARARDDYRRHHANVASPLPSTVHPQVRELLTRFLDDNGLLDRDLSLPLTETGESEAEMIARYRADAEAEFQEATAILAAREREVALAKVRGAQDALDAIENRSAPYAPVSAETVAVALEEPTRRRGRPPRVQLDPAADVLPE